MFQGGRVLLQPSLSNGVGSGMDFVMDETECVGSETALIDCRHKTNHNCDLRTQVAAIQCNPRKLMGE